MDGWPNRRYKAAFSNFSGVARTLPKSSMNCIAVLGKGTEIFFFYLLKFRC